MAATLPCRCCLLRSPDKELKVPYVFLGKTEVYADMLKECFEIHLSMGNMEGDSGICEVCIMRLREAQDFRIQVLECQKNFHSQEFSVKAESDTKVKVEVDDANDIVFMDLKEELTDYGDYQDSDDCKLAELLGLRGVTVRKKSDKKKKKQLMISDKDVTAKIFRPLKVRDLSELKMVQHPSPRELVSEGKKQKQNIENLLKNSNCIPFLNKTIAGIHCGYCKVLCPNMKELRHHTRETHKNEDYLDKFRDLNNLSIKVDITDLTCNICNAKFDLVTSLKKHLTKDHDIKFYDDVKDYLLEFKLTDDEILNCALCNSTFETFKMLLQHMNGHYRNYVCEVCDMGFVNRHRLKNHQRTHEIGDFQCSFCDKVFSTRVRKMCHEKYTHNTNARYKTNCPNCDKSFTSYYQRNRHMFTEHNTSAATYRCNICDKSFILKSKLTSHIKKVHLMERNHICPECGQGFFIKQSLDEHMVKHNGERVYKCLVCQKAYARKKTLREHMRIHNNDRRFKCGVCDLAFVQKCSLKSHMLSNHGITLAEFEGARELASSASVNKES